MTGTTTAPGYISLVSDSTTFITSGRSGDGLLGLASPTNEILICGSATISISLSRTDAGDTPGRMRQFTFAVASCGSALLAWPPARRVATQVVRIIEFQYGTAAESRAAAARSGVARATARMSAPIFGSLCTAAERSKYARVTSLSCTGKSNFASRARPSDRR
jgi:hypothetical protein